MSVMEEPRLPDEITEFVALESVIGPADFRHRAGPWFRDERWRQTLAKWPVETGIVRNDEIGRFDKSIEGAEIDRLSSYHLIGDAGETGDLCRYRTRRLPERTEHTDGACHINFGSAIVA